MPSEVVLEPGDDPIPERSAINLDSVEGVSVAVLIERLGRLSDDRMRQVCMALEVAVDCPGSNLLADHGNDVVVPHEGS